MGGLGTVSRPVVGLLSLLQMGAAAAVIAITGLQMANVDLRSMDSVIHQQVCLLSDTGNTAICMYAYALGAVSMFFTLFIGLLQVCTCNMCGCGAIMDSVFAMMAAAWWVVGALVISSNATRANNAGLQKPEWRSALAWLTWVNAMLFGAMFAVHVIRVVGKYCNCCRRRRGPEEDAEKAMLSNHGRSVAALELGNEVKSRHYMQHQSPHLQQQFMADGRNI